MKVGKPLVALFSAKNQLYWGSIKVRSQKLKLAKLQVLRKALRVYMFMNIFTYFEVQKASCKVRHAVARHSV
jgi:hypothetical protein